MSYYNIVYYIMLYINIYIYIYYFIQFIYVNQLINLTNLLEINFIHLAHHSLVYNYFIRFISLFLFFSIFNFYLWYRFKNYNKIIHLYCLVQPHSLKFHYVSIENCSFDSIP